MAIVVGDEKILAQEKIQLAGGEHAILPAVIHRMNHHEKIKRKLVLLLRRVFLDLRRQAGFHTVLDGQRMEVKQFFEHELRLLGRGILEVNPEKQIRVRQQRGHEKHLNVLAVQAALGGKGKGADHAFGFEGQERPAAPE